MPSCPTPRGARDLTKVGRSVFCTPFDNFHAFNARKFADAIVFDEILPLAQWRERRDKGEVSCNLVYTSVRQ